MVCFIKLLFLDKIVVNIFENITIGALWFNLYAMQMVIILALRAPVQE